MHRAMIARREAGAFAAHRPRRACRIRRRVVALVVFRSKAAGEILMFAEPARRLLGIIGKADLERGVIVADEVGAALERLVRAVEAETAELQAARAQGNAPPEPDEDMPRMLHPVTLRQRAYPLIEMLRAAQKRHVDVTWGV
jgi:hypothetical protein